MTGSALVRKPHYVGHAQQLYLWAITEGLREDNPAESLPVPRTSRRLPRPVSEDGLMAALAAAPARVRPWLVLAAWCGLRACEIAGLRRDSIMEDAQPPVLIVRADATKGTRERTVPLCAFVIGEVIPGLPASGYAFRRCDGQPGPNAPWMISQLGGECLRNAGIPATRRWSGLTASMTSSCGTSRTPTRTRSGTARDHRPPRSPRRR
jgi:integrase